MNDFDRLLHPDDIMYAMRRQEAVEKYLKLNIRQLENQAEVQFKSKPNQNDQEMQRRLMDDLLNSKFVPPGVRKGILDSTSGTTGNVLIRQDLEPTLYALFVKQFPAWERLKKAPANGLVHAATQITSPDAVNALGATVITELGTVTYVNSGYARATFPVAVFATGRGVSFKEVAAVECCRLAA